MTAVPTYDDILAAAERIRGEATHTPLITNETLDAVTGARVFLKPECLQRTGSFKFRGAYNTLAQIPDAARAAGVVACSSGNHAQGVAAAARLLGMPATIVMPSDAPAIKIERTRGHGAEVVLYDRATEDRDALTEALALKKGATLVHPFENFGVVSGQGTVGLEIVDDMAALGEAPDAVLVCCGGGGLTAGVALAVKTRVPAAAVYSVEPEGFDDQARSFAAGERLANVRTSGSVCDAILTPKPGEIAFAINKPRIAKGLVVSDEEAMKAVAFAVRELKLVVEPGGAVALAAVLGAKADFRGKRVAVVLSGGNIDPGIFARALAM